MCIRDRGRAGERGSERESEKRVRRWPESSGRVSRMSAASFQYASAPSTSLSCTRQTCGSEVCVRDSCVRADV
eukprot:3023720-Rhodomonas_salina.2